jgi:hypothetical protein
MEVEMNLRKLKDNELLASIQTEVQKERQTLIVILQHLREIEVRKLFSELGYQSLFDYAVTELKYSRGEAGRKIQAMRLLKELPQMEKKIESGAISLTHICQVQSFSFQRRKQAHHSLSPQQKLQIFEKIENTSTRESEKVLLEMLPIQPLPIEKKRQVSPSAVEMRFVMDEKLNSKLEEVRSLLGLKALRMTFAELIEEMAELSLVSLKAKRFGKRRSTESVTEPLTNSVVVSGDKVSAKAISKKLKYFIWHRDRGQCTQCGSRHNLNFDHIQPRALGGVHSPENLRVLCFHCNQRRALVTFGFRLEKT